jgi:hypothetical protein
METLQPNQNLPLPPEASSPEKKPFLLPLESHSKTFKFLVVILAELILLLGAFSLGLQVGFHKADFTYSWISHYPKNFTGPGGAQLMPPPPDNGEFFNAHGLFGIILSNNGDKGLIIKDSDGNEKTILLGQGTTIRLNYQTIQQQNLKANQEIVIIGEPNGLGQIQARFVRILDQK